MGNLKELFLSRNSLLSIGKVTFNGLIGLKMLDLSDNRLISIDSEAFPYLLKLKVFLLFRNPIVKELPKLLDRQKVKIVDSKKV